MNLYLRVHRGSNCCEVKHKEGTKLFLLKYSVCTTDKLWTKES